MKTTQLGIELGSRHLRIAATKKKEFLKIKNMIAFDEDVKSKQSEMKHLICMRNSHIV